jgi:hypothetical protein
VKEGGVSLTQVDSLPRLFGGSGSIEWTPQINFWGRREITIIDQGVLNTYSVNEVANRVMGLFSGAKNEKGSLDLEEFRGYHKLWVDLKGAYKSTDSLLEKACRFTRFCCWFRELSVTDYTTRFRFENGCLSGYFGGVDAHEYGSDASFNYLLAWRIAAFPSTMKDDDKKKLSGMRIFLDRAGNPTYPSEYKATQKTWPEIVTIVEIDVFQEYNKLVHILLCYGKNESDGSCQVTWFT